MNPAAFTEKSTYRHAHENFDAAVVPAVEAALAELLARGSVTLDLRDVRFADSSAIGLLVRLQAKYAGAMWVTNVGPQLERCLSRAPANRLPPRVASLATGDVRTHRFQPARPALAARCDVNGMADSCTLPRLVIPAALPVPSND